MVNGISIGPPLNKVTANKHSIYGARQDGALVEYNGEPGDWTVIGTGMSVTQLATTETELYALLADGTVMNYLAPLQWVTVGANMASLTAGGELLYALDRNAGLQLYHGIPMAWHLVDTGPFSQAVTNGRELFAMPRDRSAVLQYQDNPPNWTTIGGPASWLYAGGNALYGVSPNKKILARYLGIPQSWETIGGNAAALAGLGLYLFGISPDLQGVWVFDGTNWTPYYAGPVNALCTGGRYLYLVTPAATVQYVPDLAAQKEAEREPDDTVTAGRPWQWLFPVSDMVGAGYIGAVKLTLFWGDRRQQQITLPRTSFRRATTYSFDLQIDDDSTPLESISLGGAHNFFNDQIRLDTVTATDPSRWLQYEWPVNQRLPNGETINIRSIVTHIPQPTEPLTLYVWPFLGSDVAWGHVSCLLDNGTYISWWPAGIDQLPRLQCVPEVYSAPARNPQTYNDDLSMEGGASPTQFLVTGLDHTAIHAWWQTFRVCHRWETLTQNCSTTVAQALWAGGAGRRLSVAAWTRWSMPGVWTPNRLLTFGADINRGPGPKPAGPGDADAISPTR